LTVDAPSPRGRPEKRGCRCKPGKGMNVEDAIIKNLEYQINPWMAQIRINGKKVHLGCFKTEKEAHEAYIEKRKAVV